MSVRQNLFILVFAFFMPVVLCAMDTSNINSTDSTVTGTSSGSHNDDGSVSGRP